MKRCKTKFDLGAGTFYCDKYYGHMGQHSCGFEYGGLEITLQWASVPRKELPSHKLQSDKSGLTPLERALNTRFPSGEYDWSPPSTMMIRKGGFREGWKACQEYMEGE